MTDAEIADSAALGSTFSSTLLGSSLTKRATLRRARNTLTEHRISKRPSPQHARNAVCRERLDRPKSFYLQEQTNLSRYSIASGRHSDGMLDVGAVRIEGKNVGTDALLGRIREVLDEENSAP